MTGGIGDRNGWRRSGRLVIGLAALLAGVTAFAAGAARVGADALSAWGLAPDVATVVAGAGAAALPLVVFGAVLVTIGADRRFQRIAAGGGTLVVVAIAVAIASPTPLENPLALTVYALGTVVLLVALVGGVVESTGSSTATGRPTPGYVRSPSRDRVTPSDGGEEEDDLEFPLDDEE